MTTDRTADGALSPELEAIAAAAQVSHGTVRAILTRSSTATDNGHAAEQQSPDSERDEIAA